MATPLGSRCLLGAVISRSGLAVFLSPYLFSTGSILVTWDLMSSNIAFTIV